MSRVHLTQYLTFDITISEHFSFQPLPEFAIEENVICFWEDEQASFIIAADEQPPYPSHDQHWQELGNSLTKEFGQLSIAEEGTYSTQDDVPVSYKIYRAGEGDEASSLIYHLISNKRASYWVIGSLLFCAEPDAVNPIIMALMETAKLK